MKNKFSSMWRVAVALVLVLSLSLVMAVPVSADVTTPSVTLNDYGAGKTGVEYTVEFDVTQPLGVGSTITVTFPTETTVPGSFALTDITVEDMDDSLPDGATDTVSEVTVDGKAVTITTASDTIQVNHTVDVVFTTDAAIGNPSDAGDYQLNVHTSAEPTDVPSAAYSIIGLAVKVYNNATPPVLVDSYDTITAALAAGTTLANYTIEVGPGVYTPAATLSITQEGLTLKATGRTAETIIDASELTDDNAPAIHVWVNDVTVDGFTVDRAAGGGTSDGIWIQNGTEGVTVKNNIIRNATTGTAIVLQLEPTYPTVIIDDATISGNVIEDCSSGIFLQGSAKDCTISDNTIRNCARAISFYGGTSVDKTQGNTITGNTITGITGGAAIRLGTGYGLTPADVKYFEDNSIEGNTISDSSEDGISIAAELDITNLTITSNDIIHQLAAGITIGSWGSTNAINYNNIYDNDTGNINNATYSLVDAENNWWNTLGESNIEAKLSGHVDYSPWLNAPYPDGESTTSSVAAITLHAGWNFISVPRRMAAATNTFGELLTGISTDTSYSYDAATGTWSVLTDATLVEVLEGYWLDVNEAGTITPSYLEEGQTVPASKSLTGDAWNAIGFSSTTATDADTALMSIDGSWSTLIAWDAEGEAYEDAIIATGTTGAGDMSPGKGYWIWMTEADVLSAISG